MYQWLVSDVTTVVKDVLDASQTRPEKQVYMSLPRPGVCIYVLCNSIFNEYVNYVITVSGSLI